MPTMTNPETGETKEVSMEEFMKMVSKGGGSVGIQQVVTDKDGNKHVTDIYGNISGMNDGLDRSVNVFCHMSDLSPFVLRLIDGVDEVEEEDNPDEKGFVMNVDLMDTAATIVITKAETKCTAELFTRDERKSNSPINLIDSSEWDVVDGAIQMEISAETLKANKMQYFLLGCVGLRKYIKKEGTFAKLKELGNKGTGIIVSVKDDNIDIRIVRGKNRPNLPCNMFFFGEQMMRPYPDELMTNMMMSNMSIEDKISAAEGGYPDCMESLAQAYLNGDEVEQDFEKAAYWWEKLANTGNAIGQFNIGLHYAKGCGVKRDFAKAAEWMNKAAENGDEDAPEVAKLYGEAAENLRKAEAGDATAQAAVAKLYMQIGGSLEQFGAGDDYSESFKWAKKATDQGDLDGIYCLGLCYEHARGTNYNPIKAAMTYQKAAESGHAPSQWNLAVCYLNGQGYERNETKGLSWAYEAAAQGYDLAIQGLERQGKAIPQIIERFSNDETGVTLEGTQYEGRADRCERIRAGMELTYKIVKDKNGDDAIECFYNGGTVGLISKWIVSDIIALLNMNRISLTIKVKSCTPKSKRGARARNADVRLNLIIKEKKPETPEERALRLEAERVAAERAKREAEEKRKHEEEAAKRKAAEEKAHREKEEAERKRKEEEDRRINAEMMKKRPDRIKYLEYASGLVSASMDGFAYVKPDGTVVSHSKYSNIGGKGAPGDTSKFSNVRHVVCTQDGIVGLRYDGTCIATKPGFTYAYINECNSWRDIVAIAAGDHQVVGLRKNGTCVANSIKWNTGYGYDGQSDVSGWSDIIAIACCDNFSMGLKSNGTVVLACTSDFCKVNGVKEWTNIEMIAAGRDAAVGLTKDGRIVSAGKVSTSGIDPKKGIVQMMICCGQAYALYVDGTVGGGENRSPVIKEKNVISMTKTLRTIYVLTEDGNIHSYNHDTWSKVPASIRIFDSYNKIMDDRIKEEERKRKDAEEAERKRIEEEKLRNERKIQGVCQYCGGTFKKGLFSTKCTSCGKKKDY